MRYYGGGSHECFCSLVGRQKFVREVLSAASSARGGEKEAERERLHFFRPAENDPLPERPSPSTTNHQGKPSWHNLKKRQRQSEKRDGSHQSPPTKRLSSSALSAEDNDLLNSYWGVWPCSTLGTAGVCRQALEPRWTIQAGELKVPFLGCSWRNVLEIKFCIIYTSTSLRDCWFELADF